ncbi:hypothetical protein IPL85_04040 [Candidatus Saccharibacteria bacterium]|nr:MAG: hypothetical protein IPL85_04040 [Candidatus Saccharibacteria bacterium]
MSSLKLPLKTKLKIAATNTGRIVLKNPLYFVLAVATAFLMLAIIIWSLNYELAGYIITNPDMTFDQKVRFFGYGYEALFTSFDSFLSVSITSLSLLFGINIAVLTYALRRKTASARASGTSGLAATLGILSSGCAACGTSLLGPLLATFGATSLTAVHNIGAAFSLVGSALLLYSIYKITLQTQTKG